MKLESNILGRTITIGLLGLNFGSVNLGCSALAYAFRKMLLDVLSDSYPKLKIHLIIFTYADESSYIPEETDNVDEEVIQYSFKNPSSIKKMADRLSKCDLSFDMTEGDSFTDIYGMKRFATSSFLKVLALSRCGKLMLAPQTYGPFQRTITKRVAAGLIERCTAVFARDAMSADAVLELTGRRPTTTTDVAFYLPYNQVERVSSDKVRVGVNVSGLLWSGGYTQDNQFGLSVDYRQYIYSLLEALALDSEIETHIIPHVMGTYPILESDWDVSVDLCLKYPNCTLAPNFKTPMEAKSYISGMNVFTGARMHATIAAFSSGVPTIPFSYSRKFEGLYGSLGYRHGVNGREVTTDEAVTMTIDQVGNRNFLAEDQKVSLVKAGEAIREFKKELTISISSIQEG